MTLKQQKIYECIKEYIKMYNEAPTIREICLMADLNSPATVHKHLKNLEKLGYIEIEHGVKKGIRINNE